jgi:hypothetical protein
MVSSADTALGKRATERLQRLRIVERYRLARTAIRAGCVFGIFWLMEQAAVMFAGQTTSVAVTAALSVVADLKFALSLSLAGLATIWALAERRLRYRKTEELQNRNRQLEISKDPHRSSSGLTPVGKTNPKDKPK